MLWTAHDLRRKTATLMAELGVSGDVIDECLNHMIESRIRRVYIRDRRIAVQAKAFDLLGAELSALARLPGDARATRHHGVSVQRSGETPSERNDPEQPRRNSDSRNFNADARPRSATVVIRKNDRGMIGA